MSIIDLYRKCVLSIVPENLEKQLKSEKGTVREAATIMVLGSVLIILVNVISSFISFALIPDVSSLVTNIMLSIIGIPIMTVLFGLVSNAVMYLLAKALGGKGTFENQFFQFAYPMAGISLINGAVALVPCVGSLVSFALAIYSIFIAYLIYKSVHKISSNKAALLALLPMILMLVLLVVVMALFAASLTTLAGSMGGLQATP